MRISHTAFIQNRKTTYWKQQSLQSLFCLEDLFFVFFSRKILFYSASITVIFQIIITALELVMPDLLGALGIVLFLYPIGWYRIIIRLLVRIGSGGVLSYFLASLCPYLYFFWKTNFRLNCKTAQQTYRLPLDLAVGLCYIYGIKRREEPL